VQRGREPPNPLMITGYNTDVRHGEVVFHVQTEDKGAGNPFIESLVYVGGQVVATKRAGYADLLAEGKDDKEIIALMDHQHRTMIAAIRHGKLDGRLAALSSRAGGSITVAGDLSDDLDPIPSLASAAAAALGALGAAAPGHAPAPVPAGSTHAPVAPASAPPRAPVPPGAAPAPPLGAVPAGSASAPPRGAAPASAPVLPRPLAAGAPAAGGGGAGGMAGAGAPFAPAPAAPSPRPPLPGGATPGGVAPPPRSPAAAGGSARPPAAAAPERTLDQVILEYLTNEADQEQLVLLLDGDSQLGLGRRAALALRATSSKSGQPIAGAQVSVRMISTVSEPRILAHGRTDDQGALPLAFEIPTLDRGTAALIITAVSSIGRAELKHLL
jgi:hypothetical protein